MRYSTPGMSLETAKNAVRMAGGWLLQAFLLITMVCVFVPFSPSMPGEGLDPSWILGANQAVAQGLMFGRDIIFTNGPYASIFTKAYHPATDGLMLGGNLYLGLSFGIAILLLFRKRKWYLQLALPVVFASGMYSSNTLLFYYYPLLVGVCCFRLMMGSIEFGSKVISQRILLVTLLFPFGLLPLVKGTALIMCAAVAALVSLLFATEKYWKNAFLVFFVPFSALIFFWAVLGQPLSGLPLYFTSIFPIISGYTEAMMVNGIMWETAFYIIASVALLWVLFLEETSKFKNRLFLVSIFSVCLFLAFKSGFVRHEPYHTITSSGFIFFAALLLSALYPSRRTVFVLFLSIAVSLYIDSHFPRPGSRNVLQGVKSTYSRAWQGVKMRIADEERLEIKYKERITELRAKANFPRLQGTTDIYSYNQSYLISSGNIWNPRPIFQSYSTYTSTLVEKNKNHLLGHDAPDNLIFRVEPIDRKIPSLEDGASWPVILSNYEPTGMKDDFLFLKRLAVGRNIPELVVKRELHALGDIVALPKSDTAIFAKIDINQNVLGTIANALYKPTQLRIRLNLDDGTSRSYRLVAGMAKTGLLISPLVENTAEFGLLYAGMEYLADKKVKSFAIDAVTGNMLWSSEYEIEFIELDLPENAQVVKLFDFAQ